MIKMLPHSIIMHANKLIRDFSCRIHLMEILSCSSPPYIPRCVAFVLYSFPSTHLPQVQLNRKSSNFHKNSMHWVDLIYSRRHSFSTQIEYITLNLSRQIDRYSIQVVSVNCPIHPLPTNRIYNPIIAIVSSIQPVFLFASRQTRIYSHLQYLMRSHMGYFNFQTHIGLRRVT